MHPSFSFSRRALAISSLVVTLLCVRPTGFAQFGSGGVQPGGVGGPGGSTYVIDDGIAEQSVGLMAGGNAIFLNSFQTTISTITQISVAFGLPGGAGPNLNGTAFTVVLWSDPNGDGLPGDAVVLAMANSVISGFGTNTFVDVNISPTLVLTPNFFVGFLINHPAGSFPAAMDQTDPDLLNRSFAAVTGNINDLSGAFPIENAGANFVGNWLIRATAIPEPSAGILTGLGLVGLLGAQRFLRRRRGN